MWEQSSQKAAVVVTVAAVAVRQWKMQQIHCYRTRPTWKRRDQGSSWTFRLMRCVLACRSMLSESFSCFTANNHYMSVRRSLLEESGKALAQYVQHASQVEKGRSHHFLFEIRHQGALIF